MYSSTSIINAIVNPRIQIILNPDAPTLQISMWTAGIVVMTLLVNAPLIPLLLKWTGLSQVSKVKAKIRAKAARAFTRYTENAVDDLKNDEDEMLRGKQKGFQYDCIQCIYSTCTTNPV